MATETLFCKVGQHYWSREAVRGRKPIACPDHRGGDVQQMIRVQGENVPLKPVEETLYCEVGQHKWHRPPTRGRKPSSCPEHAPQPQKPAERRTEVPQGVPALFAKVITAESSTEPPEQTLWCEAGDHEWTRPPARGKRPTSCPEHRSTTSVSSTSRPRVMPLAELMTRYHVDSESQRVLSYIEQEVANPNRQSEDVQALMKAYHGRMRYVQRGAPRNPNEVVQNV